VEFGPGSEDRGVGVIRHFPKRQAGRILPKKPKLFDGYGTFRRIIPLQICEASCFSPLQTDSKFSYWREFTQ
jgi:hypothetical protein